MNMQIIHVDSSHLLQIEWYILKERLLPFLMCIMRSQHILDV